MTYMPYLLSFAEGVITFVSPCLLPMLPLYISYFAGKKSSILKNSVAFVFGFSVVYICLGVFASSLGMILYNHKKLVNMVSGVIIILFGLNYLSIIRIPFPMMKSNFEMNTGGFLQSFIFGMVFSLSWTPCTGAFLGTALFMAAQKADILNGIIMLLLFSSGLGIPFILSAILIDNFKIAFNFIKRNYSIINTVSGILLILTGILTLTGHIDYLLSILSL